VAVVGDGDGEGCLVGSRSSKVHAEASTASTEVIRTAAPSVRFMTEPYARNTPLKTATARGTLAGSRPRACP
jgi:hypothetical protein